MKKEIRLVDLSFYGDLSSSRERISQYIEWYRGPDKKPITVFTDLCLPLAYQYKDTYKVAWLIEPYVINPNTYKFIQERHADFDLILTHHKMYCDINPSKVIWYPFGGLWIKEKDWQQSPIKTRNISIIASNKNWAIGHQLRHQIVKEVKNLDVYGSGYKPIENKIDALKDYKFSVTIENCRAHGYFTEKIIDCFMTKTVPIYWGDPDIDKIFNPKGIILIKQISDIKAGDYEAMKPYIDENFEIAKKFLVAEDWIHENIFIPRGVYEH